MSEFSVKHVCPQNLNWQTVDVYGAAMDKATVQRAFTTNIIAMGMTDDMVALYKTLRAGQ